MTKHWSFAKITDFLLKIEVSDRISKSLSQQIFGCPSPFNYDAPEEVGGDRKCFDSPIRK